MDIAAEVAAPHSLDAETSALGAILVQNSALIDVAGILKPAHFYRQAHQHIYAAMLALDAVGPIDETLLVGELRRVGQLDECGGPAFIATLSNGVPRGTNLKYYAEVILDHALRRALIAEAQRTLTLAYLAEVPGRELLVDTEARLLLVDQRLDGASDATSAARMALDVGPVLDALWLKGGHRGLGTGIVALDDITKGAKPGQLIVIGARPSMGKSAAALQFAMRAAEAVPTLFFSLEMSKTELTLRGLSMLSHITSDLLTGDIGHAPPQHAQRRIAEAAQTWSQLDLHVDTTTTITIAGLRSKVRRFRQRHHGIGLVVVDYLQLMQSDHPSRQENRNEALGAISAGLKRLAGEFDVPIYLLSQLNRNLEHRVDKRPTLSDLRESGAIEQDADNVYLLHRPGYYDRLATDVSYAEFIVAKQRNGPTGIAAATWQASYTTFEDRSPTSHQESAA